MSYTKPSHFMAASSKLRERSQWRTATRNRHSFPRFRGSWEMNFLRSSCQRRGEQLNSLEYSGNIARESNRSLLSDGHKGASKEANAHAISAATAHGLNP